MREQASERTLPAAIPWRANTLVFVGVINHSIITRSDTLTKEALQDAIFPRQSELTAITRYTLFSHVVALSPSLFFSFSLFPSPFLSFSLSYVATFATFHGRSNILRNYSLASFIASFRIETEFTIVQWQSAFPATFARGPQFFGGEELKAPSSTSERGWISTVLIGNERLASSMTSLRLRIVRLRMRIYIYICGDAYVCAAWKISRTIIVSKRAFLYLYIYMCVCVRVHI